MMPPEGTPLHWFLTNRKIHLWISLSVLISLVFGVWLSDFLHNTPYRDLLPPNSMFFAHPFTFAGRWIEIYNMHVTYVTMQTVEMRKQKIEDVKKRSEYRKAHDLDQGEGIFGGWTTKTDDESLGPVLKENADLLQPDQAIAVDVAQATTKNIDGRSGDAQETFVDFEGKEQPVKKKWFGVW